MNATTLTDIATALWVLGGVLLLAAGVAFAVTLCRRFKSLQRMELSTGNLKHRHRIADGAAKQGKAMQTVVRAEYLPGWVWVRITPRPPKRGVRPRDNVDEQIGWALTRRGAKWKRDNTDPRVRTERGDISDMLVTVMVLVVAAAFISKVSADVTPGDVLDWILGKVEDLVERAVS